MRSLKNCNTLNWKNYSIVIYFFLFLLTSCSVSQYSTSNSLGFTQEKIMKLRTGMTSEEIAILFGNPLRTEATQYGLATPNPWTAIIWYYDSKEFSTKKFIFSQQNGTLYLVSWEVK